MKIMKRLMLAVLVSLGVGLYLGAKSVVMQEGDQKRTKSTGLKRASSPKSRIKSSPGHSPRNRSSIAKSPRTQTSSSNVTLKKTAHSPKKKSSSLKASPKKTTLKKASPNGKKYVNKYSPIDTKKSSKKVSPASKKKLNKVAPTDVKSAKKSSKATKAVKSPKKVSSGKNVYKGGNHVNVVKGGHWYGNKTYVNVVHTYPGFSWGGFGTGFGIGVVLGGSIDPFLYPTSWRYRSFWGTPMLWTSPWGEWSFYSNYGSWHHANWGIWYYPWSRSWYNPSLAYWYYPNFGVTVHVAKRNRVIYIENENKENCVAVYEKVQNRSGGYTLYQRYLNQLSRYERVQIPLQGNPDSYVALVDSCDQLGEVLQQDANGQFVEVTDVDSRYLERGELVGSDADENDPVLVKIRRQRKEHDYRKMQQALDNEASRYEVQD